MSEMVYGIATCEQPSWQSCVASWHETASKVYPHRIIRHFDVLEAYQIAYEDSTEPVIAYIHDDVMIYEPNWDVRVLKEFEDPTVGLVGFGGAWGHGEPWMYQRPFEVPSLVRKGFMSNQRTAERDGSRMTGERDVAVLDGFAMFVRRELLDKIGGWPQEGPIGYLCYDYFLSCVARRHGYRIRLVGVNCQHLGGKSTGLNPNLKVDFEAAHKAIYDEFKDVLPAEVK
jgi:GT2 family glycosyltransferase